MPYEVNAMETKEIVKMLNDRGHYVRETESPVLGVPDVIACVGGWFLAVENKRASERITPLQEAHRIQILHDNGVVMVDPEEAELLEALKFLEGNPGGRVRQVIAAVPHKGNVPRALWKLCKSEYGRDLPN